MARRTRPFLMLALALASGGTAAFLALRYIRQQATPLMAAQPRNAQVVVAARNLPVGTVLEQKDLKSIEWIGTAVPPGFIGNPQQAVSRGLITAVAENEPILEAKLAAQGIGGGLPIIIEPGMRAFSMAVDQIVGVAGWVLPSTRVDVLLTMTDIQGNKEPATKIIMQNVRTLAAGQSIQQDKEGKPQTVGVVTFLLTPEQAETLALASGQGRIQLALRNTLDTSMANTRGTRQSALMGRIGAPQVASGPRGARRPPAAQVAVPEPTATIIEVYRGGQRTLQKF
ncbi:MAG TPA: Flp pilus assembly protein CpaB [Gemmatimonadales bacterium]|nr:Flp pilus assembly protein CpaB [Gemmatimonadales bacterium]